MTGIETEVVTKAMETTPGMVALVLLVLSGLAVPMTKGVTPNIRASVFVFLILAFLTSSFLAFNVGAGSGNGGTGGDGGQSMGTLDQGDNENRNGQESDLDDAAPVVSYHAQSINQPVRKGNMLPLDGNRKLVVNAVHTNGCDIAIQDAQQLTLQTHSFSSPGVLDFETFRIRFTKVGKAGLFNACYFDVQVQQAGDGN